MQSHQNTFLCVQNYWKPATLAVNINFLTLLLLMLYCLCISVILLKYVLALSSRLRTNWILSNNRKSSSHQELRRKYLENTNCFPVLWYVRGSQLPQLSCSKFKMCKNGQVMQAGQKCMKKGVAGEISNKQRLGQIPAEMRVQRGGQNLAWEINILECTLSSPAFLPS